MAIWSGAAAPLRKATNRDHSTRFSQRRCAARGMRRNKAALQASPVDRAGSDAGFRSGKRRLNGESHVHDRCYSDALVKNG